jgi:DNA polymerase-3 subunit delta
MAVNAHKTLRDAVKLGRFDGAYYVYGEDEFQKDDAVTQLVAAAVEPATRDFNLDIRRGGDLDAETIGSIVATPPMMAARRVVVVRDVNALRKDARAALDRYLAHPSPDVLLLLVTGTGAKADKALERNTTPLEFNALEDNRIPKWIIHHADTELGATITEDAADLLHDAVGNDLYQLAGELDKLASYANGATITEDAVSAVVGIRRGETVSDLLDRVLQRDANGARDLIPHVLTQPKTSGVSIVMGLSTQMLAVAWGRARLDTGLPSGRLEGEYFDLLKRTGAYPGRPWGSAARAWAAAARDWSVEECDRALEALLAADIALKESRVSSEEQIVSTAVLAVCSAGSETGRRRAA